MSNPFKESRLKALQVRRDATIRSLWLVFSDLSNVQAAIRRYTNGEDGDLPCYDDEQITRAVTEPV